MDKQYYIDEYNTFWNKCWKEAEKMAEDVETYGENFDIQLEATEHFEECANAAQVVGYYLVWYEEKAFNAWMENTEGIEYSKQDYEVKDILSKLCSR